MTASSGRAWLRAALVFAIVVGLDQASKAAVRSSIPRGDSEKLFLGINLVNTRNKGVAFGLLSGGGAAVVAIIGAALLQLVVYFSLHTGSPLLWLPPGLFLGGAIANLVDRLVGDA